MNDLTQTLSPEKLQSFTDGLTVLTPEEVRKAKIQYLRQAISDYEAMKVRIKTPWSLTEESNIPSSALVITSPKFWSWLWLKSSFQKQISFSELQLIRQRIQTTILLWRKELIGERFKVDESEIAL